VAAQRRQGVVVNDYKTWPLAVRRFAEETPITALMAEPLLYHDQLLGVILVSHETPDRTFTEADRETLALFARPAAIAITNARLFGERLAAEAAARENARRLATLVSNLPGYTYRVANDPDYTAEFISEGVVTITGYTQEEYLVTRVTACGREIHPDDAGAVWDLVQRAVAAREPYQCSYRILVKSGELKWVWEQGRGVYGEDGSLQALEGFVTDVTPIKRTEEARKQLERELRQAQKMEAVGRLAGGIAHDFNNLLTVIIGRSRHLADRLGADDPARRDVELIEKSAGRGAALTQQLLAFSRQQVLEIQPVDLNRVVADIEPMLRRLLGEDIEFTVHLSEGVGLVMADPGQVDQVILNLAVNARDAMPSGGRFTIETWNVELDDAFVKAHPGARPGPHVALTARDTGVGIDELTLAQIFEPFFTTKDVGKGTGLGLSTVYGIVKQHDGYIAVDSRRGEGATFTVYLRHHEGEVVTPGTRPTRAGPLQGSETILLVEDADEVRDLIAEILRENGYTVLEARAGEEAEAIADRHGGMIDLLITDVVMPRMGGRELADHISRRYPQLRMLYVSGYAAPEFEGGRLTPTGAFLSKPFAVEALLLKVREILAR
jgi:PAS domain S-box-containing protein